MNIEISIREDIRPLQIPHHHGVKSSVGYNLYFVVKDNDCGRIWSTPATDESGLLIRYGSVQAALLDAEVKRNSLTLSAAF